MEPFASTTPAKPEGFKWYKICDNQAKFALPAGGETVGGIASAARLVREMEFVFPIAELDPSSRGNLEERPLSVVRGYIRGSLDVVFEQDGKTFDAKKNFVWTCNKDTKEQASNMGNVVAIMRITDLMA